MRLPRPGKQALLAAAFAATLALPAVPAHAWLGVLGKLGSTAGKAGAGAAAKGAATGVGVVGGAEALNAAGQMGKAGKLGVAGEGGAATTAATADDIARSTGLGKAVPDEVAAMLQTPGKTLADVPDPGTRNWLATPSSKLGPADADLMVRDYVALLEGKPAAGPASPGVRKVSQERAKPLLPTSTPPSRVPWHAAELVVRAAHLGHQGARQEVERLCRANPKAPECRDRGTPAKR